MSEQVRVGIMGAGSVGCYLGAQLALTNRVDVVFVGRRRVRDEIEAHGLRVKDVDGSSHSPNRQHYEFTEDAEAIRDCEVVLCCVKSAQTDSVARAMASSLRKDALVVSMQNGVGNPAALRRHLGDRRVLAGIVDFNVVSQGNGLFQRTMAGPLRIERFNGTSWQRILEGWRAMGMPVLESDDIEPEQWTKLLVNLNNSVSALSGASTPTLMLSTDYRNTIAALIEEGLRVVRAAGIKPAKFRGLPIAWMPRILRLPTPIVRLVTRAQLRASAEARSSMWEDLERRRPTEVDYLNGEIIALGERVGVPTRYNRRITALVHQAEELAQGSPRLSGARLWDALEGTSDS